MYEAKIYTGEELDAMLAELAATLEDEQIDAMAEEHDDCRNGEWDRPLVRAILFGGGPGNRVNAYMRPRKKFV